MAFESLDFVYHPSHDVTRPAAAKTFDGRRDF
jgi:hypothetical protein